MKKIFFTLLISTLMFSCQKEFINEQEPISIYKSMSIDALENQSIFYQGFVLETFSHEIFAYNLGDHKITRITNNVLNRWERARAISPDMTKVAFAVKINGDQQGNLWISNLDGSNPEQLTFDNRYILDIQWNPDGNSIFMTEYFYDGNWYNGLTQVNINTKEIIRLLDSYNHPEWTFGNFPHYFDVEPDGKSILLPLKTYWDKPADVYELKLDSKKLKLKEITKTNDIHEDWPIYSKSGNSIAAVTYSNSSVEILLEVMGKNGQSRRIVSNRNDSRSINEIEFSNDENFVVFGRCNSQELNGGLYLVDLKQDKVVFEKNIDNCAFMGFQFMPDNENLLLFEWIDNGITVNLYRFNLNDKTLTKMSDKDFVQARNIYGTIPTTILSRLPNY